MLVCHISMRPPRRIIGADLAEAATAFDSATTGFVVFATLVDDPAAVRDTLDAYLGEIMVEAASVADNFTVGLDFVGAIDEAVTATDSVDGTTTSISMRSAMLAGPSTVFINPGLSREANINGIMINQ
jgi:hypothetical protein